MTTVRAKSGPKPGNPHSGQFKAGNDPRRYIARATPRHKELVELARTHTEKAIETMAAIMNDDDEHAMTRLAAADKLLCRGHGNPVNSLQIKEMDASGTDLGDVDLDNLRFMAAKIIQEHGDSPDIIEHDAQA